MSQRDPLDLLEHPVDPDPGDEAVGLGEEVDVARSLVDRLHDDRVHELDRRRVGEAVLGLEIGLAVLERQLVGDQGGTGVDLLSALVPAQLCFDLRAGGDDEVDRLP